ncbi:zf-HC2 domain-containing protein [candidate division KSB1 bacterium]|nr:zf-HC2 domain-containing protein [candidate division KSB1 bacterium]
MKHPSEDQIQAYIDHKLNPEDKEMVRNHLRTCPVCRRTVRSYQRIYEQLKVEPNWQFSLQFDARVMRKISKESLGEIYNKLWYALLIFGIFIAVISITVAYTDAQSYLNMVRNISLPRFDMNWDFLKSFNFLPDVSSLFKGTKLNAHFMVLCIIVLVVIVLIDQAIQFARTRTHQGV